MQYIPRRSEFMSDAPPAAGRTAEQPIVLDVERTHIQRESERLHWSARKLGEIPKNWPLRLWAEIEHMGTANGGDHRRPRSLVSGALTVRRTAALPPADRRHHRQAAR
jgi:hypothetical protein